VKAAEFASLLHARPVGRGKWLGLCPAHRDRSPSLSIGAGQGGRVIAFCFAGCALTAVLNAMGLRLRDLFSTESRSLDQKRWLEAYRARAEATGRVMSEAAAEAYQLEMFVNALGAELARLPDDDPWGTALAAQFHVACADAHAAEVGWEIRKVKRAEIRTLDPLRKAMNYGQQLNVQSV
jgi:hypothetical protein